MLPLRKDVNLHAGHATFGALGAFMFDTQAQLANDKASG